MSVVVASLVILLLFPAVVEHACEKTIDDNAEHERNDVAGEQGVAQAVRAFFWAASKPITKRLIIVALVVQFLIESIRVDRRGNKKDEHCNDPQNKAKQEDIVHDLAIRCIVLVTDSHDEGDHEDRVTDSCEPLLLDEEADHLNHDQGAENESARRQAAATAAGVVVFVQATHI